MVDVVANNVMATSTTPDLSKYMFKEAVGYSLHSFSDFHMLTPPQFVPI